MSLPDGSRPLRRGRPRTALVGAFGLAAAAVSVAAVAASTPSAAQDADLCEVSLDFNEVGSHEFIVPDGVEAIEVLALGAQGGDVVGPSPQFGDGGLGGGMVDPIDLPVGEGDVLDVRVGEQGANSQGSGGSGPGGFNGGGTGSAGTAHTGSGGGGASSVHLGPDVLLMVGGGGGAAHGGDGGHGGLDGTDGTRHDGSSASSDATPGSSGGNGGMAGVGNEAIHNAFPGSDGEGGDGGGDPADPPVDGGGGGGGGFVGGGGGGGGPGNGGAGGGGGSSFDSTDEADFTTGERAGDGLVSISYTDPACTDLGVVKTAALSDYPTIAYTVEVTNYGPHDATGVTVEDALPDEVDYVSDDCGAGPGDPWTWQIGDLELDDSVTCVLLVAATTSGPIDNVATVSSNERDPNPDNDDDTTTVEVPFGADLGIVKTAEPTSARPGDSVVYTLVATNHGLDDATGVTVEDTLPDEVDYVSDGCAAGPGDPWTWTIGDLAVGASVTCEITVTLIALGDDDTLVNVAVIDGDQPDLVPGNNTSTAIMGTGCPSPPVADPDHPAFDADCVPDEEEEEPPAPPVTSEPQEPSSSSPPPPLPRTGLDPAMLLLMGLTIFGIGPALVATGRLRSSSAAALVDGKHLRTPDRVGGRHLRRPERFVGRHLRGKN